MTGGNTGRLVLYLLVIAAFGIGALPAPPG
jgi:hypothetical protein